MQYSIKTKKDFTVNQLNSNKRISIINKSLLFRLNINNICSYELICKEADGCPDGRSC